MDVDMEIDNLLRSPNPLESPGLVLQAQRQQKLDLPENIWKAMWYLHKSITTAIPATKRQIWIEKIDSFYNQYFNNR
jgi:G:T-mismatch repair DNA endonuclease (very short patch repair protein)